MLDTHGVGATGGVQGEIGPQRLRPHVDDRLSPHQGQGGLEGQPLRLGSVHETASGRSRHEAGAGAPSSRVGPMNMVAGALLAAVGIAASVASYHSIIELDAPLVFVFYGTIFVGGVEFAYGILRSLDG